MKDISEKGENLEFDKSRVFDRKSWLFYFNYLKIKSFLNKKIENIRMFFQKYPEFISYYFFFIIFGFV